jgi:SAM-dependent methyltransferase
MGEAGVHHARGKPFSDRDVGGQLAQFAAVLALLPPPPARVLDLGCGMGWTSRLLAACGYRVHGCDISEDMIRHARELHGQVAYLAEAPAYSVEDFEELPFDGCFDAVLSYDCLHHATEPAAVVRGVFRALVAGGVAVVSEPGKGHASDPAAIEAVKRYDVAENDMPPALVKRLGQAAGFRDFNVYPHARSIHAAVYGRPGRSGWKHTLLSSSLGQWAGLTYLRMWRAQRDGVVWMRR